MIVRRQDLERELEALRDEVKRPREGIHGPGSLAWEIGREAAVFLGGGRAALLQLAHPFVAYAIDQHSQTRQDPIRRFDRTFANVYSMIFGDLESAIRAARRVHSVHERIVGTIDADVGRFPSGTRYRANDVDSLLWVHATLIDSAVLVYDKMVRPLSAVERERYYVESKRFARLFGIPHDHLPATWPDFQDYMERMFASDTLAVSPPAAAICDFLLRPKRWPASLAMSWYRAMTAALLPLRLREAYGLSLSSRDELTFEASIAVLRRTIHRVPSRLRDVPDYVEARRRLAGRARADRYGRTIQRLILHTLRPA